MAGGVGRRQALVQHIRFPGRGGRMRRRELRIGGSVMENGDMGRVTTEATIYNLGDLIEVSRGKMTPDQLRKVTVTDALVDTGATTLGLPGALIRQLGLTKQYEKRAVTAAGIQTISVYEAVR